ncbi:MAG: hypothetical protein ACMG6S_25195, partial [Byssovorax sp.]
MNFWRSSGAGRRGSALVWVVLGGVLAAATFLGIVIALRWSGGERAIGYTELSRIAAAGAGPVSEVRVEGERVTVARASGERLAAVVADSEARHAIVERFVAAGVPVTFASREAGPALDVARVLIPLVALAAIGATLLLRRRKASSAGVFVATGSAGRVRFSDVAGMDEAKESLV